MSVLNWLEILEEKICNEVILIKVTLLTIQNLHTFKKNHLQTAQNACIRFYLRMERRKSNRINHFEKINWLPVTNRADPCIVIIIYIFKNNFSPAYMSDMTNLYPCCQNKNICGQISRADSSRKIIQKINFVFGI